MTTETKTPISSKKSEDRFFLDHSSLENSDYEQSRIRLLLPLLVVIWSLFHPLEFPVELDLLRLGPLDPHTSVAAYYFFLGLIIWSLWPSVHRAYSRYAGVLRGFCLFADISAISVYSAVSEHASIVLMPVYVSAIVGYGMRFGRRHLLIALALSLIEFTASAAINPYLFNDIPLVFTYVIAMVCLPMYTLSLLQKYSTVLGAYIDATNERDLFIDILSHEFRAPLHSIISLAETCNLQFSGKYDSETVIRTVPFIIKNIQECGERMLAIANRVAMAQKIERGTKEDREIFSFLFHDVYLSIRVCAIHAKTKSLRLFWFIDENVPSTSDFESAILQEILINLLDNAIKHTLVGTISLSVNYVARSETDGVIEISVVDTGVGLKAIDSSIVAPSSFNHSPLTRSGAGLGIMLIQKQVDRLSGELLFEKNAPAGTRVTVRLPTKKLIDHYPDSLDWAHALVFSRRELVEDEIRSFCAARIFPHLICSAEQAASELFQTPVRICVHLADQVRSFDNDERSAMWSAVGEVPVVWLGETPTQADLDNVYPFVNMAVDNAHICDTAISRLKSIHTFSYGQDSSLDAPLAHQTIGFDASVLLIDDSSLTVEATNRILSNFGCRCTATLSIEDALDALERQTFDVIIADRFLGSTDLLEFVDDSQFPQLDLHRVLLVSAESSTTQELEKRQISVGGVLVKPVSGTALVNSVRELYQRSIEGFHERYVGADVLKMNPEQLDEFSGGDLDLDDLSNLAARFQDEMLKDAMYLNSHLLSRDVPRAIAVLHRMIGLSSLIGAEGLSAEMIEIRAALKDCEDQDVIWSRARRIGVLVNAVSRKLTQMSRPKN